ncbi:MAG: fused MFS/spermidine synthase, partial [Pseudomonadota bacterium]
GVLLTLAGPRTLPKRTLALAVFCAIAAVFAFEVITSGLGISMNMWLMLAVTAAFGVAMSLFHRTPAAILVGVTAFLLLDGVKGQTEHLFEDRSFFGAHKVYDFDDRRIYVNGTTVHGTQRIAEQGTRPTPLSYYHPTSPMAQVLQSDFGDGAERIGVVGLGVGSLACYAQPGQTWDFYEIDEMVDRVARDPELFSYMSQCVPNSETFLGDARVVLTGQDVRYDVLFLDAYSSDSIPMHLLTREALQLYRDRVQDSGVLVFHITNRYYDISMPLARLADDLGLSAAIQTLPMDDPNVGSHSTVLVMSPDADRFDALLTDTRWDRLRTDGGAVWTDDFANPLSALKYFAD